MTTRTEIRKAVGRGQFTAADLAAAREVTVRTARNTLRDLLDEGVVEVTGQRPITDPEGNPARGRPRTLFRVTRNPA